MLLNHQLSFLVLRRVWEKGDAGRLLLPPNFAEQYEFYFAYKRQLWLRS